MLEKIIGALVVGFVIGVVCSQLFIGFTQDRESKMAALDAMCFHYAGVVGGPSDVLYGIKNFTVMCEGSYVGTNWSHNASI